MPGMPSDKAAQHTLVAGQLCVPHRLIALLADPPAMHHCVFMHAAQLEVALHAPLRSTRSPRYPPDAAPSAPGIAPVQGCVVEWEGVKRTRHHTFGIVDPMGTSLIRISASTHEVAEQWMQALEAAGCLRRTLSTLARQRSPLRGADIRWVGCPPLPLLPARATRRMRACGWSTTRKLTDASSTHGPGGVTLRCMACVIVPQHACLPAAMSHAAQCKQSIAHVMHSYALRCCHGSSRR